MSQLLWSMLGTISKSIKMGIISAISIFSALFFVGCNNNTKPVSEQESSKDTIVFHADTPSDTIPKDCETYVSEDGRVTFYSWNTGMGGTCPDFAVRCKIKMDNGKYHVYQLKGEDELNSVGWVQWVHAIDKNDGSTYYIVNRDHNISSKEGYSWMDAFVIEGDKLKPVSVYDGGDDVKGISMEICYDIPYWYFATNGEGWGWMYEYDVHTKDLYVPETTQDYPGEITDRYTVYHFDGMRFISQGSQAHKGLHKSLQDYDRLEYFFRTKGHIVRIDRLRNGDLRYASWQSNASMSDTPDLVICGGRCDSKTGQYIFTNKGYVYLCKVTEYMQINAEKSQSQEYLIVKKGDKVLLKEKVVLW